MVSFFVLRISDQHLASISRSPLMSAGVAGRICIDMTKLLTFRQQITKVHFKQLQIVGAKCAEQAGAFLTLRFSGINPTLDLNPT
jgi:hypothetical protein